MAAPAVGTARHDATHYSQQVFDPAPFPPHGSLELETVSNRTLHHTLRSSISLTSNSNGHFIQRVPHGRQAADKRTMAPEKDLRHLDSNS